MFNVFFPHHLVKNWDPIRRKLGDTVHKKATAFEVLKKSKDLQDLLQTFSGQGKSMQNGRPPVSGFFLFVGVDVGCTSLGLAENLAYRLSSIEIATSS